MTRGRGRNASSSSVGVARCLLDIAERYTGIETGGYERMAEGVRPNCFVDTGPPGHPPDGPASRVAVEALAVAVYEDRPAHALPDREVDRPRCSRGQRDGHDLAALAQHGERAVAALEAERFDVGADGFRDSEAV